MFDLQKISEVGAMASVGVYRLIGITTLLVTFVVADFCLHDWLEEHERNQMRSENEQQTSSTEN